jgi:hypothetical protein
MTDCQDGRRRARRLIAVMGALAASTLRQSLRHPLPRMTAAQNTSRSSTTPRHKSTWSSGRKSLLHTRWGAARIGRTRLGRRERAPSPRRTRFDRMGTDRSSPASMRPRAPPSMARTRPRVRRHFRLRPHWRRWWHPRCPLAPAHLETIRPQPHPDERPTTVRHYLPQHCPHTRQGSPRESWRTSPRNARSWWTPFAPLACTFSRKSSASYCKERRRFGSRRGPCHRPSNARRPCEPSGIFLPNVYDKCSRDVVVRTPSICAQEEQRVAEKR